MYTENNRPRTKDKPHSATSKHQTSYPQHSSTSALSNWRCMVFLSGPCEGAAQIAECAIITAHANTPLTSHTLLQQATSTAVNTLSALLQQLLLVHENCQLTCRPVWWSYMNIIPSLATGAAAYTGAFKTPLATRYGSAPTCRVSGCDSSTRSTSCATLLAGKQLEKSSWAWQRQKNGWQHMVILGKKSTRSANAVMA
jgi:hypothetical protein